MRFVILLEILTAFFLLLLIITQIIIPAARGTRMFWFFKKKPEPALKVSSTLEEKVENAEKLHGEAVDTIRKTKEEVQSELSRAQQLKDRTEGLISEN